MCRGKKRESEGRTEEGADGPQVQACGRPKSLPSAFDQSHRTTARTLPGLFGCELHPLSFAQELEHGAADGAAMEKVLDTALVADESEPLINQESSDRPGWHTRVLRCTAPPRRSRRLTSRAQENTTS